MTPGARTVAIQAPAKINLHLEVGKTRCDGFHEILSLFQAVSLYDEITVELRGEDGDCHISGDFPCEMEDNLIYKALELFRGGTGDRRGVAFSVDKNIPSEAGLGGGSSDAAAVLKALVLLLEQDPGERELSRMAAELGSDVPFFLGSPSAAVTGRGEQLADAGYVPDLQGLIVRGAGPGISTGAAYAAVDRAAEKGLLSRNLLSCEEMLHHFRETEPRDWPFYNSFMETFRNDYKGLALISNLLYDSEAVFAGLSGSGSALFGVFSDGNAADRAERLLKGQFPFVERIYFLRGIPEAVVI